MMGTDKQKAISRNQHRNNVWTITKKSELELDIDEAIRAKGEAERKYIAAARKAHDAARALTIAEKIRVEHAVHQNTYNRYVVATFGRVAYSAALKILYRSKDKWEHTLKKLETLIKKRLFLRNIDDCD